VVPLVGLGLLTLLASEPSARAEDQRCKGTKQFYAGKCRYPDEIGRLRDEERKRREAAEQAKQKAEQDKLRQERADADKKACAEAEADGSKQAWEKYLQAYGDGLCGEKARSAISAFEAAAKPAEPAAATPDTGDGEGRDSAATSPAWAPTTLFWVGAGVTAAGVITWAVAGGILVGKSNDLEEQCPDARCPANREGDLDSAEVTAHVTTVGAVVTGVGAALTLVGALWPLFDPEPASGELPDAGEQAGLRITPLLGGSFVGVRADF
jgi:hypothetical protein